MSPDEIAALEAELADNNEQRAALKERAREIVARLDVLRAEEEAALHLERLSDPERAALAQLIQTEGIESTATVGDSGSED